MTNWTYDRNYAAHLEHSSDDLPKTWPNNVVTIPDQIADDQPHHDLAGTTFPAILRGGDVITVKLDGEAYSLHTPGIGDPIVIPA